LRLRLPNTAITSVPALPYAAARYPPFNRF
jgi:hypothetical protein